MKQQERDRERERVDEMEGEAKSVTSSDSGWNCILKRWNLTHSNGEMLQFYILKTILIAHKIKMKIYIKSKPVKNADDKKGQTIFCMI